jgi:hypothetical protein
MASGELVAAARPWPQETERGSARPIGTTKPVDDPARRWIGFPGCPVQPYNSAVHSTAPVLSGASGTDRDA